MKHKQFKRIYIEITNVCNLNCSFCVPDKRLKEYMSIDNFNIILDNIKPYTDYILLHVKGEPLMHPLVNEFIDTAYAKGFNVNITTNGTLLDNLTSKNMRQINYSMQSNNNVLSIKNTIHKLREFIKNTNIYLSLRLWSNASKENIDLENMLKKEFNIIAINDKMKLDKNIFLSIENEFKWPNLDDDANYETGYCHGLKDQIAILVDGTVVPCCLDHNGNINLGNIFNEDLNNILSSIRALRIINGFKNRKLVEDLCKTCNYKNRF